MFIILYVTSRILRILYLLTAAAFLATCTARPPDDSSTRLWRSADLRTLEAPNVIDPAWDLVAGYARLTTTDLELRFDLLGSPAPDAYDLLVLVDTRAGNTMHSGQLPIDQAPGMDWNLALSFPAYGAPRAFDASGAPVEIRPRIIRSSGLDAAIVRISLAELAHLSGGRADPRSSVFEAFIVRRGLTAVADTIGPLRVDGPAITASAPLLLEFWDSLPAATPAQALRRWDGAHTGPFGQRHGLSVLLDASAAANVPLALLDLRQPDALAALDALGGLPKIKDLVQRNLLLAPELAASAPQTAPTALRYDQQAAQRYDLPASAFLYGSASALTSATPAAFTRVGDGLRVVQWGSTRLIPLPAGSLAADAQASEDGLTIAARQSLLAAALASGTSAPLTVLGGSLPQSAWGDSLVAGPTMDFIAGHPWIHPLRASDLLSLPAVPGAPDCPDLLCQAGDEPAPVSAARAALEAAPPGPFTDLGWNTYFSLTSSAAEPGLAALREQYLGQVGVLAAAAHWNAAPTSQSVCGPDLDGDGSPDCVLSSAQTFLVIDPLGGRLALAAGRRNGQPVEIIGPRSQRAVGLSDPHDWRPDLALAADPQEIAGGFAGLIAPRERCQPEAQPGVLILTCPESRARLVYRLVDGGFQVEIAAPAAFHAQIPLLLADSHAMQPGWYARYQAQPASASELAWGVRGGARVRVLAQGAMLTMHHFAESLVLLSRPEDPNTAAPPGAYLPFPMAVIDLDSPGSAAVAIYLE